ncbi:alpha/beta-type small acid-soluble spore protein [Effusibacillus dendaii]|uniref:Spore protein n=1 Tax=Effusibacillus dendaii TaxID=2743772 RepID=A0A7I8DAI1_9BACL|nr:alpha/beta-type small acid-soluble spore protein [Effusibacillus dendaii]BCJ86997.1 hypothetical protein skT53_19820 [Effusibacillus dendaii]
MARRNLLVVRAANQALNQMRYEVAEELGISTPADDYWGTMTTRDTGAIGGHITRKLVAFAQQQLVGLNPQSAAVQANTEETVITE